MTERHNDISSIERPRLWRLALQIDTDAIRAVVWSTVEESSLLHFSLPLDPARDRRKAIEEAVYAAPVLLSDFGSVDVVVRTRAYSVVPEGLDDDMHERLAEYLRLSADSPCTVYADAVPDSGAAVLWTLDTDVANFLARTFRNPTMHCHISLLMRYFSRKSLLGNSGKIYLHLHANGRGRSADILAFGTDGRPAVVTTHAIPSDDDALYYTLASANIAGLDPAEDEILLCGDHAARDSVMPRLRQYAACVMPVIFPSAAFRNGREALNAPFPLVILPLCE